MPLGSVVLAGFVLCSGCAVGGSQATFAPPSDDAPVLAATRAVIIANSLGESLSHYDPNPSPPVLTNDKALTGQSPEDLVIAGDQLLVVNSLSNSIGVYDLETLALKHEWSTGARSNPWHALVLDGTAWITCWASHELIALDLADGTISVRVPVPADLPRDGDEPTKAYPQGIASTIDETTLLMTCSNLDGSFAAGGPAVVWTVARTGDTASSGGLITLPTGRDTADLVRTTVGGREAFVVACAGDFDASEGYLENGSIHLIDGPTLTELAAIPVASAPVRVAAFGTMAFGAGAQRGDICVVDLVERVAQPSLQLPDSGTGLNFCSALAVLDADHLLALDFNGDRLYLVEVSTGKMSEGLTVGDGPIALVVVPQSP